MFFGNEEASREENIRRHKHSKTTDQRDFFQRDWNYILR